MADPGFSWGANSQSGCANLFFCRKLHENERIWTPRGARVPSAPLDPPMIVYESAIGWLWLDSWKESKFDGLYFIPSYRS